MSALCIVGGSIGYFRTRSVPSLVAGTLTGVAYGIAARRMQTGQTYGPELAAAASLLLFASSVPRFAKGPVPKALTIASALAGAYYANVLYRNRVGF